MSTAHAAPAAKKSTWKKPLGLKIILANAVILLIWWVFAYQARAEKKKHEFEIDIPSTSTSVSSPVVTTTEETTCPTCNQGIENPLKKLHICIPKITASAYPMSDTIVVDSVYPVRLNAGEEKTIPGQGYFLATRYHTGGLYYYTNNCSNIKNVILGNGTKIDPCGCDEITLSPVDTSMTIGTIYMTHK
jgi:hypothetical protein